MSNMSYCRFENTLNDLLDCLYIFKNEEYIKSQREVNRAKEMLEEMTEFLSSRGIVDVDSNTWTRIEKLIDDVTDPSLKKDEEE